ncbi:centromere protein U isoform X2 [Echeneis naucrates]|uniref:centromere protein U isoform X2 n=1 Tax=Echeneis naucrates TaxID=173247 RepID=UPI001113991B|nr:centromere protein U isoform X2 [Echeneis naucrates]
MRASFCVQMQKESSCRPADSPNLSAIEKASFLQAVQLNYGNPLHSTAMEEDLNVLEEEEVDKGKTGGKGIPEKLKTIPKKHRAAEKTKQIEPEKKRRSAARKEVKTRPVKGGKTKKKKGEAEEENTETNYSGIPQTSNQANLKQLVGKKPVKGTNAGKKSVERWMRKNIKSKRGSSRGKSSDAESQEVFETSQQRHIRVLSSDEEVDSDTSWTQTPKEPGVYNFYRTRQASSGSKSRKSSSGSTSGEAEEANRDKRKRKRHVGQGGTDLDVVLDAFLHFCDEYRESVESKAVKQSIDSFSSNVKEQLLEKISSYKELRGLKRENAKVGSLTRKKTQRLLDAKHELMRADRQISLLQKEKAELTSRLHDLKQSSALLNNIRELNQHYLDHRRNRPTEKETYGAFSLPALLLETKELLSAENQLRGINNHLEKILK